MHVDTLPLLRFAAAFLWADLHIAAPERLFFSRLACELGVPSGDVAELLDAPPSPEHIDPTTVPPALAARVREVALRAIAADGVVEPGEMDLFHLLDELLPDAARDAPVAHGARTAAHREAS